jgi:hypothetical protein
MEEVAFIHLQLPAAQTPFRAQQEMKTKYSIFEFIQNSPAYKTEIRNIFFVFAAPNRTPILAADDFKPRMAHVLLLLKAISESGMAAPKDLSQNTIAGCFRALPACPVTQSKSLALRAGLFRRCDGL